METHHLLYRLPICGDDDAGTLRSPPKPRLTLRVGVIGHRPNRMTGCDPEALQQLLNKALREIAGGVGDLAVDPEVAPLFSEAPPELRLVTGIAHGIDEMAIRGMLQLRDEDGPSGRPPENLSGRVSWRLELVSPAPLAIAAAHAWDDRACVSGSFEAQTQAYIERWNWLRASADTIAQLPSVWMSLPAGQGANIPTELISPLVADADEREALIWGIENGYALSYAAAGEFLLRNVDILLAFWDGGPSAGGGGTLDLIERAHAGGLPVVLTMLDDLEAGARQLISIEAAQSDREIVANSRPIGRMVMAPGSIFSEGFADVIKPLLAPPVVSQSVKSLVAAPETAPTHHGHEADHHVPLASYFEERLSEFESSRTYDRFLDLWLGKPGSALGAMFVGVLRRTRKLPLLLSSALGKHSRKCMDASYRLNPRKPDARHHWAETEWHRFLGQMSSSGLQFERVRAGLLPRFIVADELAVDYANRYRSSVILSYLLATLAVTLAIIGLAFAGESKLLKAGLLASEFIIITWILLMVSASRKDRHHGKLVTYRALAEGLRQMLFLAPLGEFPPVASKQAAPEDWVTWYRLATARELGLPTGVFDRKRLSSFLDGVVSSEVEPQIAYHRRSAEKLSTVTHHLHAFGDVLFFGTLLSVALSLMLIVAYFAFPALAWGWALKITGSAAAILPALGAALTGIRYALDLETKAERQYPSGEGRGVKR